jgi:hypothetical protein
VQKRLGDLKEDDALLFREGTQGLTKEELKAACDARGATSVGLTEAEYRAQLDEWLLLSVKHDISATLLLLFFAEWQPSTDIIEKDFVGSFICELSRRKSVESISNDITLDGFLAYIDTFFWKIWRFPQPDLS